ncbi:MAG TPA: ATP-binding cassette domain-containing protein, partial [Acidimicrobiales bacterium]
MTAHVRFTAVDARYGHQRVLQHVDLAVAPGEFVGIVGPSGSGKTTLLRLLTGQISPSAGTVERTEGLRLAYVPQVETVNWSFPVTVAECVLMGRVSGR